MSALLNAVYNNYLTSYAPNRLTRYDTHKKSELRNVYNSIVKLNKESPWFLPTTNKDTQRYAVNLKENARGLHNTIASMNGLEESDLLNKKTAFSSDESVAAASFIGSVSAEDASPSFTMEVHSLATSQENLGNFLDSEKIKMIPDTYSFDISINDMNYEFQFAIGEAETNRDVQERLVRLINNADIGLNASLAESEGKSALKLTSESTGLNYGRNVVFDITDSHTSKSSGAVEYLGLDYVSRQAANAVFSLNGEERSAISNHFTVGKMFEVTLNGISPENQPVTVGLKTDVESLTDNVVNVLDSYNSFMKAAANFVESQPRSRYLMNEMKGIASYYQNSLEAMGLNMQNDGMMSIDKDQLYQAASDSEDISTAFEFMKDFTGQLMRKTNQISINPMDYVEKTIVAYKNPGRNFVSPYVTSSYSGMMFNSYC